MQVKVWKYGINIKEKTHGIPQNLSKSCFVLLSYLLGWKKKRAARLIGWGNASIGRLTASTSTLQNQTIHLKSRLPFTVKLNGGVWGERLYQKLYRDISNGLILQIEFFSPKSNGFFFVHLCNPHTLWLSVYPVMKKKVVPRHQTLWSLMR